MVWATQDPDSLSKLFLIEGLTSALKLYRGKRRRHTQGTNENKKNWFTEVFTSLEENETVLYLW